MDEIIQKLKTVNYTLNQVEVHGQANLDRLLGCMQALREAIDRLAQAKTQTAGG